MEEHDSDCDESIYTVQSKPKQQYFTELAVETPTGDQAKCTRFQLDSGATCSTTRMEDYKKLNDAPPVP